METRLGGLRVLVLEDDREITDAVSLILRLHGADLASATTAREALTRAAEQQFDVIVADIALPREDGVEFLRELRRQERDRAAGGKAHVIAMSGYSGREDRERVARAGFELFLAKPVDANDLVLAIRMCADGQAAAFAAARRPA